MNYHWNWGVFLQESPEGGVFFAGEHTARYRWRATMNGAVDSGDRVAREPVGEGSRPRPPAGPAELRRPEGDRDLDRSDDLVRNGRSGGPLWGLSGGVDGVGAGTHGSHRSAHVPTLGPTARIDVERPTRGPPRAV